MTVWYFCPKCNKDTSEDLKASQGANPRCSNCGQDLITGSLPP